MAERLVALERAGVLKLYAINGTGAREVGSLEVGVLTEESAVMVAAALSDLRSAVNNGQPAPAQHTGERVAHTRSLPSSSLPRARSGISPDDLHNRIVAYLRQNGPSTTPEIAQALRIVAIGRSSPTKRVSNAVYHMASTGRVERLGRGRWAAAT
jgi:hypothetical protein